MKSAALKSRAPAGHSLKLTDVGRGDRRITISRLPDGD